MSTEPTAAASEPKAQAPQHRLVLLGASNLARGIATAVQAARGVFKQPLDLMAALGHGRSYGRRSMVLGRTLPGIVQCGLWDDLQQRPPLKTSAIITDPGNDIVYGATNEQILAWMRECLDRLSPFETKIVMTGVPLESVSRLRRIEFFIFRSILYPFCRIGYDEAMQQARELNDQLRDLAQERGITWIQPRPTWYGFDRIHIRRSAQAAAWHAFFLPLAARAGLKMPVAELREFVYVRCLTPCERTVFRFPQGRDQPSGRLRDGTLVSLY